MVLPQLASSCFVSWRCCSFACCWLYLCHVSWFVWQSWIMTLLSLSRNENWDQCKKTLLRMKQEQSERLRWLQKCHCCSGVWSLQLSFVSKSFQREVQRHEYESHHTIYVLQRLTRVAASNVQPDSQNLAVYTFSKKTFVQEFRCHHSFEPIESSLLVFGVPIKFTASHYWKTLCYVNVRARKHLILRLLPFGSKGNHYTHTLRLQSRHQWCATVLWEMGKDTLVRLPLHQPWPDLD